MTEPLAALRMRLRRKPVDYTGRLAGLTTTFGGPTPPHSQG
ncbi:MAG: hypothetical protein NTX27_08870 [Verrucomicrobia bacterium]|nr:hypothetical protein [Verrucomicrobiota bacterium]